MIYEITLSNGYGDHVEMIVEAETAEKAKAAAVKHLKTLPRHERDCGLNGAAPDMVRARTLIRRNGIYKVSAFNHEMGGFC